MSELRILVIGHTGFLGRHLCDHLRAAYPGAKLFGMSRQGHLRDDMEVYACDLVDEERVEDVLREARPRWIFHLGGTPPSGDLDAMIRQHTLPTAALLQAVMALPDLQARVILPGSAAEYGRVPRHLHPLKEDAPVDPVSPYGVAKVGATNHARAMSLQGADVVIARIFNAVGAGMGQWMSTASFVRQLVEIELGRREPVLETGNLAPKRDLVDAGDIARALALLAEGGRQGQIYNVCTGKSVPVRTVVRRLLALTRVPVALRVREERVRRVDVPDMRGSYAKLRAEVDWSPRVRLSQSLSAMMEHDRRVLSQVSGDASAQAVR